MSICLLFYQDADIYYVDDLDVPEDFLSYVESGQ